MKEWASNGPATASTYRDYFDDMQPLIRLLDLLTTRVDTWENMRTVVDTRGGCFRPSHPVGIPEEEVPSFQ